jgi:hypothetical protein
VAVCFVFIWPVSLLSETAKSSVILPQADHSASGCSSELLAIPAKLNAYSGWNPNGIPG